MSETVEAERVRKRQRTATDNDFQHFMRSAIESEIATYRSMHGASGAKKKAFRDEVQAAQTRNHRGVINKATNDVTTEFKKGTLNTIWKIAEAEGGLMDRATGIRCATNWCSSCAKRGPPLVMWDPSAGLLIDMHFETG